ALQDALMARPQERPAAPVGEELARALRGAPAKPEIVAIAALLSAQDVRADPKATYEPGWKFGNWIRQATRAELSAAEFHAVADALLRVQLYDVMREFAAAGRRREPNERFWRFYKRTPLSSRPCLPYERRRHKQQGPFAPRTCSF